MYDDWFTLKKHRKTHLKDKLQCALCKSKFVSYGSGRKRFEAHICMQVNGVWIKARKKKQADKIRVSTLGGIQKIR